jgi:undecaprenyl diphosphate synthase
MLSHFINNGSTGHDSSEDGGGGEFDIDIDNSEPLRLMENFSTSDNSANDMLMDSYGFATKFSNSCCCLGRGQCLIGIGSCSMEGPCTSLILNWVKFMLGGAVKAYLSNPLCLALLPLVVGVAFGYWMGRYPTSVCDTNTMTSNNVSKSTFRAQSSSYEKPTFREETSLLSYILCIYNYLSLRLMFIVIYLNPFRRCSDDNNNTSNDSESLLETERDDQTRTELRHQTSNEIKRESGIEQQYIPCHIAVIMDGNRRYGKTKYGNATRGHWDGSKTLIEFSKWCISEGVQILTVYAFSTENWDRDASEVSSLMAIFCKYCDELRVEAIQRGIHIRVLTTDETKIPNDVKEGMNRMVSDTKHCDKFTMNICMSYGGRGEIVNACKNLAMDIQSGHVHIDEVNESMFQSKLLTKNSCDPDIVIRTSGEERLSNFLLWQVAYSEFFFLRKHWPELEKEDLLEVIRTFACGRKRRYGK